MITDRKIADLLKRSDPKAYASMVLGVAQAETQRAEDEVSRLEAMLQAARSRYLIAVDVEKEMGEEYDAAHGQKDGLPTAEPFRETFPAVRSNGLTDRQTNFGSY